MMKVITTAVSHSKKPSKKGLFCYRMKGFGIYVKNNLLEPKHIENMGESVWLYMWLLDKMTSVNENGVGRILGGKPITHDLIVVDLGIDVRRYQRWMKRLRDAGYIKTLRTPYGQVITITKAEKIFKSTVKQNDKNVVSQSKTTKMSHRSDKNVASETTKSSDLSDKNVRSNKDNTVDNTNTTNVVEPPAPDDKPVVYGKPEINELFDYWALSCQFNIETRVQANRRAASNLFKKYGVDKMHQLIDGVAMTHSDRYAPSIGDFCELQQKLPALIVWGRKKHGNTGVEVIS